MKSNSSPSKLEARRKIVVNKDETKKQQHKNKTMEKGWGKVVHKECIILDVSLFILSHACVFKQNNKNQDRTHKKHTYTHIHTYPQ